MKRRIVGLALVGLLGLQGVTAQSIEDLSKGLETFVEKTPSSLPFAAGSGLDWSNAYIGQLLDDEFPYVHFGVGVSAGLTTIPGSAVEPLMLALGEQLPEGLEYVPLPFAVVNARVGGILLPFDVGLKVGFVPEAYKTVGVYTIDYQNFGIDVRYRLVKSDLWLPDVSVGAGVSVMKAGVGVTFGDDISYTYDDGVGVDEVLNIGAPEATLDFEATSFDVKAQVSKTFFWFLTPYLGLGASFGSAKTSAGVEATISNTGDNFTLQDWSDLAGVPIDASSFGIDKSVGTFGVKIYGGTSVNILMVKLDIQGMYNLADEAFGATAGVRVQF